MHHRTEDTGFVLHLTTGQTSLTGLSHPHTPRVLEDAWVICNSAKHQVLHIDRKTGTIQHVLQLEGYTRGIAIADDVLIIGESANRSDPAALLAGATASLVVVCRKTWTVLERWPLPCREVYDVLLVPQALVEGLTSP